jgi:hypothetical protein
MAKKAFLLWTSLATGWTSSHQRGNLASKTTGDSYIEVIWHKDNVFAENRIIFFNKNAENRTFSA